MTEQLQRRLSAVGAATARFYRANSTLLLSAFTILSVLLIIWARLGFTFEISRFYAAQCPERLLCSNGDVVRMVQDGYGCKEEQVQDCGNGTCEATADGAECKMPTQSCGEIYGTRASCQSGTSCEAGTADGVPSNDCNICCQLPAATPVVSATPVTTEHRVISCEGPDLMTANPLYVGQQIRFDATLRCTSKDAEARCDKVNSAWVMDFGDTTPMGVCGGGGAGGISYGGCGKAVTHAYTAPGTYTVRLICDAQCESPVSCPRFHDERSIQVNVLASATPTPSVSEEPSAQPPPPASPAASPTALVSPTVTVSPTATATVSPTTTVTVSPLPCAPEGVPPDNPSLGPNNQVYNGTCCEGLVKVDFPLPTGVVGASGTRCVRPGCSYQTVQCVTTPCPTPTLICPSASVSPEIACAPKSQTVRPNRPASFTASPAWTDGIFPKWQAPEGTPYDGHGLTFSTSFKSSGTYWVSVQKGDFFDQCKVVVRSSGGGGGGYISPAPLPVSESLVVIMTGLNLTTDSAESDTIQARTGEQLELRIRVANRFASRDLSNVTLEFLPAGLTYIPGSTEIGDRPAGSDAIVSGGLSLGALQSGQDVFVTVRATADAAKYPNGTTRVQVAARGRAAGANDAGDGALVIVTRGSVGVISKVKTGPGEALLAAFLISAIMTMLYVSYTHTSTYRRHEVKDITRQHDPLDFRS